MQPSGSPPFNWSQSDGAKVAKGAAIVGLAAALTYLLDAGIPYLRTAPGANLALCTMLAIAVNAARKWVLDTTTTRLARIAFLMLGAQLSAPVFAAQVSDPGYASYRIWVRSGNAASGGSSTAISPHLVVTNVHVVGRLGAQAEVLHPLTGRKWIGQVVACEASADVALVFVSTGDLDWVEIGADPQPDQPCQLYGYGGDTVLKRGEGRFLGANGRGGRVPVWEAAVESISGDSGGGIFDSFGRIVSVNWGCDPRTHKSVSTPVSAVLELHRKWVAILTPEQNQLFGGGGCIGGQCERGGGGYGGGGGVMPPKQPIQLQPRQPIIPPPTTPLVPIAPSPVKPELTPGDLAKLADQIAAALEKQKPKPEPPPAANEPQVTIDELAKRVAERLPPIYVDKYVDGKKSGDTVTVRLGEVLNLHHGQRHPNK